MTGFSAFLWIEVMIRICASLPFQPLATGVVGVQIVFYLEAHAASEILRTFPDDQMVIGVIKHRLRNSRGSSNAFQSANRTRTFFWTVHARRVELHDTLSIR